MELDLERWIKPAIALIAIFFWLMGRRRPRSTPAPPPTRPASPPQSVTGEVSNRPIHPR
jgi:hypothetical protein